MEIFWKIGLEQGFIEDDRGMADPCRGGGSGRRGAAGPGVRRRTRSRYCASGQETRRRTCSCCDALGLDAMAVTAHFGDKARETPWRTIL